MVGLVSDDGVGAVGCVGAVGGKLPQHDAGVIDQPHATNLCGDKQTALPVLGSGPQIFPPDDGVEHINAFARHNPPCFRLDSAGTVFCFV